MRSQAKRPRQLDKHDAISLPYHDMRVNYQGMVHRPHNNSTQVRPATVLLPRRALYPSFSLVHDQASSRRLAQQTPLKRARYSLYEISPV